MFSWYVFNDVRINMNLEKNKNIYEEEIREIISYIRCEIVFIFKIIQLLSTLHNCFNLI